MMVIQSVLTDRLLYPFHVIIDNMMVMVNSTVSVTFMGKM